MFVNAIEQATQFTRAVHFISRHYGSDLVSRGAATLFFVNADGWALTCKHVVDMLVAGGPIRDKYEQFLSEHNALQNVKNRGQLVDKLVKRYGYNKEKLAELLYMFVGCVENNELGATADIDVKWHTQLDIALVHFKGSRRLLCQVFPIFAAEEPKLKQGKFLCRLGFPFAEFSNFAYDKAEERLSWLPTGRVDSPRFPLEGMVTRHLSNDLGQVFGFELSTPGLKGQSGGPAFDDTGRVWGMQYQTAHLDLDFDVNQTVIREGQKKTVRDSAFLHVGRCIHADLLKAFMRDNGVAFQEG